MTENSEFGGDLTKRPLPAGFWRAPTQALRLTHDFRPHFKVTLSTLALAHGGTLPLARATELRDRHRLVELGDGTEHLAHEPRRWRIVEERRRIVGCDKIDPALAQPGMADLLHHEVTGKAIGTLNDDCADAIGLDALQHRGEARPGVDRIGATDGRVMVGVDDRKAGLPANASTACRCRFSLSLSAPTLAAEEVRK